MRGEHPARAIAKAASKGSSPHARGAPKERNNGTYSQGIIPACAGSTGLASARTCRLQDHPRMRGEHVDGELTRLDGAGSSPHARGALWTQ